MTDQISKPLLFSSSMVRALMDGSKTQTRRVVKLPDQPFVGKNGEGIVRFDAAMSGEHFISQLRLEDASRGVKTTLQGKSIKCPHPVGSLIWVKETFKLWDNSIDSVEVQYQADDIGEPGKIVGGFTRVTNPKPKNLHARKLDGNKPWKPSIFMPRKFIRITLEVTAVKVEKLNSISEDDAKAEGITTHWLQTGIKSNSQAFYRAFPEKEGGLHCAKDAYELLWESIHGKGSWAKNPWVWCYTLKRIKP